MQYYVYVLYSKSIDRFYKGQTTDLQDRLLRHNSKRELSTSARAPWKLVWSIKKASKGEAMILERKLKNLSREKLMVFMNKHNEGMAGPDASGQDAD